MLSSSLNSYKQLGQQIANTARALASITQAYNAIKSLISAINDEDMSFGDKMGAILGSIGSLAMTATSMITMFTGSMTAAGAAGTAAAPGVTAFGAATKAAMGHVGLAIAGLTALIGVITFVVSAVNDYNKKQKELSIDYQLKKLNEEAKEANENFAALQEKSLAFAQTASEYDKLIEKFKNLSSSSSEYKETLSELLKL